MSRHARWDRGHALDLPSIRAHFWSGRDSTSCRWATHAGACCTLEPSGPSIYHTKPPHTRPALTLCTMHGPISLVTVCGSALLAQVAMRAVGGTALHHFSQLAGQLWQPRAASLGGQSKRLLGGSGQHRVPLGASRRSAHVRGWSRDIHNAC